MPAWKRIGLKLKSAEAQSTSQTARPVPLTPTEPDSRLKRKSVEARGNARNHDEQDLTFPSAPHYRGHTTGETTSNDVTDQERPTM